MTARLRERKARLSRTVGKETVPVQTRRRYRVCVFCGASNFARQEYYDAAKALGMVLAHAGVDVVYGGGKTGLMGALADAALAAGGRVYGVITEGMNTRRLAHRRLTRLLVVKNLHNRKAGMHRLSDAYVVMPGGYGTLDEAFEALTWAQTGIHEKPVGLLNICGYFDPLLQMLDRAVEEGFLFLAHRTALLCEGDAATLLDGLRTSKHPMRATKRWMRQ